MKNAENVHLFSHIFKKGNNFEKENVTVEEREVNKNFYRHVKGWYNNIRCMKSKTKQKLILKKYLIFTLKGKNLLMDEVRQRLEEIKRLKRMLKNFKKSNQEDKEEVNSLI